MSESSSDFQQMNWFARAWFLVPFVWILYIFIPAFFFDAFLDQEWVFKRSVGVIGIWVAVLIVLSLTGLDKKRHFRSQDPLNIRGKLK